MASILWWQFLIAASLLVGILTLIVFNVQHINRVRHGITLTEARQLALSGLGEALLEAETGQRGFLLTNDARYLEPYTRGSATARDQVGVVQSGAANAATRAATEHLGERVNARLAELAAAVKLAQSGQTESALRMVKDSQGQQIVEDIRVLRNRLAETEARTLTAQRADISASQQRLETLVLLGGSVALLIMFVVASRSAARLNGPMQRLLRHMEGLGRGDDTLRNGLDGQDELARLGAALDQLSGQLAVLRSERETAIRQLQDANQALRSSEMLHRQLYLDTPAMLHSIDLQGRLRSVSAEWLRTLGYAREEVIGRRVTDFLTPSSAHYAATITIPRLFQFGELRAIEFQMVHRAGHTVDVVLSAVLEKRTDGAPTHSITVLTDITARKAAERALAAREELLATTGSLAMVGGWMLDLETEALTWTDETFVLHDRSPNDAPSLPEAMTYVRPESRRLFEQAVQDCRDAGTPFELELAMLSASGRPFWARVTGALQVVVGQPRHLVGAILDISKFRAVQRELEDQHELLRVTMASIGDAVITTDAVGRVEWMNPAAELLTGWLGREARGMPLDMVFHVVNEDTGLRVSNPVQEALRLQETAGLASDSCLIARDGQRIGIEDSAAPIRDHDNQIVGAVLVFHDVSEQRRLSREMVHRATHDVLTGLVNRSEFELRVTRALARSKTENCTHGLMFIDLDQFKLVNDACGHSIGDEVLRQISTLLRHKVRDRDTVARLGGDEFAILLEHCDHEHALRIGKQICDQMEEFRFIHENRRFRLGTSIGLVTLDARWSSTAELLQAADTACYAAKDGGRNRVHTWFDLDNFTAVRQGEVSWTARLERALDDNLFELFAQRIAPLHASTDLEGLHFEVLLRLPDDNGMRILPGVFMPAAERFHLGSRIDRWVLQHTFARLEALAPALPGIAMVSINVSGQSLGDRLFHRDLKQMLEAASFDLRKLCFEVTETAAITNLADARVFIDEIRALGAKIALDDFGAGASSFGYLKNLPIDFLKIDGQFVKDMLADPLDGVAVRCFRDVAQVLGVRTIAEYVEEQEVCAALTDLRVDFAQGFLFHRPDTLANVLSQASAGATLPAPTAEAAS